MYANSILALNVCICFLSMENTAILRFRCLLLELRIYVRDHKMNTKVWDCLPRLGLFPLYRTY